VPERAGRPRSVCPAGAFHSNAQYFLKMWICGYGEVVKYTPRGRAFNSNGGTLGNTQSAVFLATVYGTYIKDSDNAKSKKYLCWARSQLRSGDASVCMFVCLSAPGTLAAQVRCCICLSVCGAQIIDLHRRLEMECTGFFLAVLMFPIGKSGSLHSKAAFAAGIPAQQRGACVLWGPDRRARDCC
jgi:hypothetical protein